MKKGLIISVLAIIWLWSCEQSNSSETGVALEREIEASTYNNNKQLSQNHDLERYIYTDTTYASFTGKGITTKQSSKRWRYCTRWNTIF